MIQRRGSARFLFEAAQPLRIGRGVLGENLDCDRSAQARVASLVDHTHPTLAQLLQNAEVAEGRADHGGAEG